MGVKVSVESLVAVNRRRRKKAVRLRSDSSQFGEGTEWNGKL